MPRPRTYTEKEQRAIEAHRQPLYNLGREHIFSEKIIAERKRQREAGTPMVSGHAGNYAEVYHHLRKHLGEVRGKRILEVGCGEGWFLYALKKMGAEVHGIEQNQKQAKLSQLAGLDVRWGRGEDARKLFPNQKFDAVITKAVLQKLTLQRTWLGGWRQPANRIMRAAGEVTAPGGIHVHLAGHESLFSPKLYARWGLRTVDHVVRPEGGVTLVLRKQPPEKAKE